MAYTSRKSSFSAPATVPACHVSPPSVVRTNVPPVPLAQTTFALTMPKACRVASVFDFCECHWAKAGETINRETTNMVFTRLRVYFSFRLFLLEFVPDYIAVLHHELDAFQLSDVSDGIASNGDEVGEFARLNGPHLILPAQHFRGVRGNGANNVKRWHPGL